MEILGAEQIPQTGPVVLCSNHSNSMLDPVIIGITARRPVRFMAKAPLFEFPVFGPLMFALGMVPAFRGMDDTKQVRRNLESLDIGAKILQGGQAMGIFPEGMSTDRAHLEKIRTGAARMALQAVEEGAGKVQIVPIGVAYERKEAFRSAVLVRVGQPIHVADVLIERENSIPKARRAVTQALESRLKEAAIHLEEPEWEPWLDDLETLVPAGANTASTGAARTEALWRRKAIADAINYFLATDRPRAESVAAEVEEYRESVRAAGLRVDSPVLETSRFRIFWTLLWGVLWLTLLFVPALAGTLFHLVPFVLVRRIASWADQPGRVTTATHRLMFGVPIYLLWYAVVAVTIVFTAPPIALMWLLLAPFAGVLALYYWRGAREEAFLLYHEVRAIIGGKQLRQLREQLAALRQRLRRLSDDYAEVSQLPDSRSGRQ